MTSTRLSNPKGATPNEILLDETGVPERCAAGFLRHGQPGAESGKARVDEGDAAGEWLCRARLVLQAERG